MCLLQNRLTVCFTFTRACWVRPTRAAGRVSVCVCSLLVAAWLTVVSVCDRPTGLRFEKAKVWGCGDWGGAPPAGLCGDPTSLPRELGWRRASFLSRFRGSRAETRTPRALRCRAFWYRRLCVTFCIMISYSVIDCDMNAVLFVLMHARISAIARAHLSAPPPAPPHICINVDIRSDVK